MLHESRPLPAWLIFDVGRRKMRALAFISVLMALFSVGCGSVARVPDVDVEIVNRSSRDLKNAEAKFGEHVCQWGIVGRTFSAGYVLYPHPITEAAELRWWEEGRGQRSEKIDLRSVYPKGSAGRLTFSVSDEGVNANFTPK